MPGNTPYDNSHHTHGCAYWHWDQCNCAYGEKEVSELSHKERKQRPVLTGVLDYFPDAILEVANVSFIGNEQHNPGEPLHWAKDKSVGHGDEIVRHLMDRGKKDSDGTRHTAKLVWRALELLQREIDAERTPVYNRTQDDNIRLGDRVRQYFGEPDKKTTEKIQEELSKQRQQVRGQRAARFEPLVPVREAEPEHKYFDPFEG